MYSNNNNAIVIVIIQKINNTMYQLWFTIAFINILPSEQLHDQEDHYYND